MPAMSSGPTHTRRSVRPPGSLVAPGLHTTCRRHTVRSLGRGDYSPSRHIQTDPLTPFVEQLDANCPGVRLRFLSTMPPQGASASSASFATPEPASQNRLLARVAPAVAVRRMKRDEECYISAIKAELWPEGPLDGLFLE